MKKIGLFIAVFMVLSCKNDVPVDYAIISGNIINKKANGLTINNGDNTIKKTMKVTENGSFLDTLKMNAGRYYLHDGKNNAELYVEAGNTINITYDANDFKRSLKYSGVGFETSSYLLAKNDKVRELRGEGTSVYLLDEADYKAKFNEIKKASQEILAASTGISQEFKVKELRNIKYSYLYQLSIYERYHAHYAEKPDFKTSKEFLDELKDLTYDLEDDFTFSNDYEKLVTNHFYDESSKIVDKDSLDEDIAFIKTVSVIPNETIKNSLLFENARYAVTYSEDIELFYHLFMKASTNEENKKVITESYEKLKTVAKGRPSPKFVNYKNFTGGTTSLDALKGKYVYVDVWATWCGPCKREIPFLQKVEKQYDGKNIEFVSLSVDKLDDFDKWEKMIKEKQLGGIQLFANNSWESDFVTAYLIKGIPRFILIDPKGIIVSSNAPRPSDSKLLELFNELNI